jgi:ankyrin repeat protein
MWTRAVLPIFSSLAAIWLAGCASYRLANRIERDHCAPLDDDMGNVIDRRRLADLESRGESARRALLRLANSDGPARACAVSWLGRLGDARVVPSLYEILSRGPGPRKSRELSDARHEALAYIGVFDGANAIPSILPFIEEPLWDVYGIAALGTIDDDRSRQMLRQLLESARDDSARRAAVEALGRLEDRQALTPLVGLSKQPNLNFWMQRALVHAFLAIDALETIEDELRLIEQIEDAQPSGSTSALALRGEVFQKLKAELDALAPSDESSRRAMLLDAAYRISGWTPLMQAAQQGYADGARRLVDAGADVNATNVFGGTALAFAAAQGHQEIVETLLDGGARDQWEGTTALMEASRNGHLAIVEALLEAGASPYAKSRGTEQTALMYAAGQGHASVVRRLLDAGAPVNATSANGGLTALMLASWHGNREVVNLLLEFGARVLDRTDSSYWENDALLFAPWGGDRGVVELLLKAGADIDVTNRDGKTPLMIAAESGQIEIVRVLLENGADVAAEDRRGYTALGWANSHVAIATMLRQAGAK